MNAARIAHRLARKLVKPLALWLNARAARSSVDEASRLMRLRHDLTILVMAEHRAHVELMARRRQIEGW